MLPSGHPGSPNSCMIPGPSGEIRCHDALRASCKERLGQALAGGAHPRRISIFESPTEQKRRDSKSYLFFFGPPTDDKSELSSLEKGTVVVPSL